MDLFTTVSCIVCYVQLTKTDSSRQVEREADMIVKIRGEERSDNWWFFEAGTVHYNHVMLSVNEIDHGVVHKDDEGKITGMHGLGIKKHIIDSEHVPAWKLVRSANE